MMLRDLEGTNRLLMKMWAVALLIILLMMLGRRFAQACSRCTPHRQIVHKQPLVNNNYNTYPQVTNLNVIYPPTAAIGSAGYAEGFSLRSPDPPSLLAEKMLSLNQASLRLTEKFNETLSRTAELSAESYNRALVAQAENKNEQLRLEAIRAVYPDKDTASGEAWTIQITSDGQVRMVRNGRDLGPDSVPSDGVGERDPPAPWLPNPPGNTSAFDGLVDLAYNKCASCHSGSKAKGGLQLFASNGVGKLLGLPAETWDKIMERISHRDPSKLMPQTASGIGVQMTAREKVAFYDYFDEVLRKEVQR